MQYIYLATILATALVCFFASLLLFARHRDGGRSRIILAVIVAFSVYNYITRFIVLCNGQTPELVVSVKLLMVANFMVLCYVLYPIEVIAPGWLSFRRIFKLYGYLMIMLLIYLVSLWAGVHFTPYRSILEMCSNPNSFDVWFRLGLSILIFAPVLVVFFIHRTHLYGNSDHIWVKKYIITISLNVLAYMLILLFNHAEFNILLFYIRIGCIMYIVYMELFDRLTVHTVPDFSTFEKMTEETTMIDAHSLPSLNKSCEEKKDSILIMRLDSYMEKHKAWRNPDLTLNRLASELHTNRTSLAQTMRENGYENYTNYINRLRIEDFIQQIELDQMQNFQEAFFFAGFRSRNTALRNFRQFTGETPSNYFLNKNT